ncbi:NAD+ synthase [Cereibacter sphaeroides]|uniref:NAD+ synthase n=1 Tax=Cereibacter sphaeroides TaxID=1063 RepID=UPI001F2F0870|nr:NAD+ synthase [Cereibacter sphaeroides]MCE6957891.1 NAD+ synthase [Cereibacter sphaeroides]MCE6971761.1 NAD+ synthase [Cereibacter sphaeroides]
MRKDALHLVLVQENPVTGDIARNTHLVLEHLDRHADADLVVFPECFLTGYPLQDLVLRPGFLAEAAEAVQRIRSEVMRKNGAAVLVGTPVGGAGLPWNAALLIEPTGAVHTVRKTELPNSDVFDERRTFAASDNPRPAPVPFRGFNLGIMICEDMWHGSVARSLADEMADVLLVINGSPYQRGKTDVRISHAAARVRATDLPLVYLNMVGGQDELVFDGASFTMNTDGAVLTAKAFEPDVLEVMLRRGRGGWCHLELAGGRDIPAWPVDPLEADWKACVLGLRDYVGKTGAPQVFVGVSGGLDSAIVLAMAADALGPDRVYGIMMPSRHTGSESLGLAADLMERLGVQAHTIGIADPVASVSSLMRPMVEAISEQSGKGKASTQRLDLADENYQARMRGMILMGLTNSMGGMVLSTGNKSEMAVGYATLYGDMAGGFNPLKSVYKSEAFAMARWRNGVDPEAHGLLGAADPIPEGIVTRPPTAELAEGQTDAASLGDYAALDTVLRALIEGRLDVEAATAVLCNAFPAKKLASLIGGWAPDVYVRRIAGMVRAAQFKRAQACPGVKLNPTDFGLGWRYPIAGRYTL